MDNGNNHKNDTDNVTPDIKDNDVLDIELEMQKTGLPIYWAVWALLIIGTGFIFPIELSRSKEDEDS